MPFFAQKKTNIVEIVDDIVQSINALLQQKEKDPEKFKKSEKSGELERNLHALNSKLQESDPGFEVVAQLCHEIYSKDLIILLIKVLGIVEFESRKDIVDIICYLVHRQVGARMPTVDYIMDKPDETIFQLLRIYPDNESALNVGLILRDLANHADLCRLMLFSENFYQFFDIFQCHIFDVASDSLSTFREFLLKHKKVTADYLRQNHEKFFNQLNTLIGMDNYVIKRQCLKLLGEVILEGANYESMIKYVSSPDNLKAIMNLLTSKSNSIKYEAFHIFKVFVANPSKPDSIIAILNRNRDKLVEYLTAFHPIKECSDEQFIDEKKYVIKCISEL